MQVHNSPFPIFPFRKSNFLSLSFLSIQGGRIGSINAVTFNVNTTADEALGRAVVAKLNLYRGSSTDVRDLFTLARAVTVRIIPYSSGSGAVTVYKSSSIKIDKGKDGGAHAIADSSLFELLYWDQGNFSSRHPELRALGLIS